MSTCKVSSCDDPDAAQRKVDSVTTMYRMICVWTNDDSDRVSAGARTHRPRDPLSSVEASPATSGGSAES